jgi:hypothetical protein
MTATRFEHVTNGSDEVVLIQQPSILADRLNFVTGKLFVIVQSMLDDDDWCMTLSTQPIVGLATTTQWC